MNRLRFTMFMLTVFLVLALNAMSTTPVLADDGTPPPTETPVAETQPTDVVTEAAPTAETQPETAPTVVPVVDETASQEIAPLDGSVSQAETAAQFLTQIPEGTDLVVTDANGEALPLASKEVAQLIDVADPMWCPTGVNPGAATCSMGYTSLTALVTDFNDGAGGLSAFAPSGNGVIWIQGNTDSGTVGTSILISGSDVGFTSIANFSLTLKGGWNGCSPGCVNTVNTNNPSIFDQSLSIINWNGDVTLSDITFSGVTLGSISNSAALNVQTTKKITLTNVKVNSNTGGGTVNGAYLNNADGAPLVFGDVSITNSQFNDNKNKGLQVFSEGMITLTNVLVNGNDAGGATLDNSSAATAKTVTIIAGTNEFSNNIGIGSGDGLNINSKGVITLKDITANNNGGDGIHLNNTAGAFVSGISFTGSTIASDNGGDGIEAYSDGAITASNLVANSNNGRGAYLDNHSAATALGITLTGSSNQFKFNGSNGLFIKSNGAITLNSVTANNNGSFGAWLDNHGFLNGLAKITLTGTNSFNENYSSGIEIYSDGTIALNNVSADKNGGSGGLYGYGLYVDNKTASLTPKTVTLTGINEFNSNYDGGLTVLSKGLITINKLTASFNQNGQGVSLNNIYSGPTSPQNITLIGNTTVNSNFGSGLVVQTYGAIALGNITANDNGQSGVSLDNSGGTLPKPVTLSGTTNEFHNNNTGSGLFISSLGAVTLNNIQSSDNGIYGLHVDNSSTSAVGGITLNGISGFINNSDSGIEMLSKGIILIQDLNSKDNGAYGAYLDNTYGGVSKVTVGTTRANWLNGFSGNFSSGLMILSNGAITLSNLDANLNVGDGVSLDNTSSGIASPQSITINGSNNFNNNGDTGLVIATYGAVVLNSINANENGTNAGAFGWGLFVDNHTPDPLLPNAITAKPVTLNGTNSFSYNFQDGLYIDTLGLIKANNLTANANGSNGAVLNNQWDFASAFGVTLTGDNRFESNFDDGLYLRSNGLVTVNDLSANGNAGDGADIDAHNNTAPIAKVTLTGNNYFMGNGDGVTSGGPGTGLIITSNNLITINNLTANGNTESGASLSGTLLSASSIKLTGVNTLSGNGVDGLYFSSPGNVDISKITTDNNGSDGVDGDSTTGNITITCGSMTNNTAYGWNLTLAIGKLLTLKGVFALGNTAGPSLQTGGTLITVRTCPLP